MGVHGRLFRNVMANLGNEIMNNMDAEIARDYAETKKLAAVEINKFNNEIKNLDSAYNNFGQIKTYMVNNPELFPLTDIQGDRTLAVDKTLSMLFQEDKDLFLGKNEEVQEKIKKRFLTPIKTKSDDPYIPAATYYDKQKSNIRDQIGRISKVKKTTDLLTTMGEFNKEVNFAEEDYKTAISTAFITANAYGIMGKTPNTQAGKDLLQIDMISIIANNAYNIKDKAAKQDFIKSKLQENGINLERLYALENPLQAKVLAVAFENELRSLSADLEAKRTRLASAIASGDRAQIDIAQQAFNDAQTLLLSSTNKYSNQIAQKYLGKFDFGTIIEPKVEQPKKQKTPKVPEKPKRVVPYDPSIEKDFEPTSP
tara:strand:- start:1300 stop:2406 length:1107 start_codon:yes stop_codon:yes gene_type:complete